MSCQTVGFGYIQRHIFSALTVQNLNILHSVRPGRGTGPDILLVGLNGRVIAEIQCVFQSRHMEQAAIFGRPFGVDAFGAPFQRVQDLLAGHFQQAC